MKVVLTGCYQLPKNPQHTGTGSKCLYLIMSSNNQLQCRLTTPTRWCWWPGTGAGRPSPATARRPWCRPTPSQRRQWSPHTAGAPPVITTVSLYSTHLGHWLFMSIIYNEACWMSTRTRVKLGSQPLQGKKPREKSSIFNASKHFKFFLWSPLNLWG